MGLCNDRRCGCAISSETLSILGSGTPEDPWVIEQAEFTDITTLQAAVDNIQAILETLPDTYVAKIGDQMTGLLTLLTSSSGLRLTRTAGDAPFLEFFRLAGTRIAYVQATDSSGLIDIVGEAGIGVRFLTDATERMRIIPSTGIVVVGKSASDVAVAGAEIFPSGAFQSTRSTAGAINFRSNKISSADANGEVHFRVDSAGTQIGSITRATSTTTAFNTSSDEELKENIVEIPDDLAMLWLDLVVPHLYQYRSFPYRPSDGVTHVGYIAQRVAYLWPESVKLGIVRPGHGRIGERTWDSEGNETTPEDVWRGWEFDYTKIPPYTHAALRAIRNRMGSLEARLDDLEERLGR